jgi:hypothetical protein
VASGSDEFVYPKHPFCFAFTYVGCTLGNAVTGRTVRIVVETEFTSQRAPTHTSVVAAPRATRASAAATHVIAHAIHTHVTARLPRAPRRRVHRDASSSVVVIIAPRARRSIDASRARDRARARPRDPPPRDRRACDRDRPRARVDASSAALDIALARVVVCRRRGARPRGSTPKIAHLKGVFDES